MKSDRNPRIISTKTELNCKINKIKIKKKHKKNRTESFNPFLILFSAATAATYFSFSTYFYIVKR